MNVVSVREPASAVWLWVASDFHIGGADTDYDLISREVRHAKRLNALCVLNGDILDLILPGDRKRYAHSAPHPRVIVPDSVGEAVRWAAELFEPVKNRIAAIGMGNHESAVLKHHSYDPVQGLAELLGVADRYVGYEGWLTIRLNRSEASGSIAYRVYLHHGSGGASPVTLGLPGLQRRRPWLPEADMIAVGHCHNQIVAPVSRCRVRGATVDQDECLLVMSGGYIKRLDSDGRRPSYAVAGGLGPQPRGGVFVRLSVRMRQTESARRAWHVVPTEVVFGWAV